MNGLQILKLLISEIYIRKKVNLGKFEPLRSCCPHIKIYQEVNKTQNANMSRRLWTNPLMPGGNEKVTHT